MSDSIGGPYLKAALLCEKVLQEQDGVVTLVRIIDRFVTQVPSGKEVKSVPVSFLRCVDVRFRLRPSADGYQDRTRIADSEKAELDYQQGSLPRRRPGRQRSCEDKPGPCRGRSLLDGRVCR